MEELGGEGLAEAAVGGSNDTTRGVRVAVQHSAHGAAPVRAGFEAIVLFDAFAAPALRRHDLGRGRTNTFLAKAHVLAAAAEN